jgi:hypothetical protein
MKTWTYFLRFFRIVRLSLILPISFFIIFSAVIVEAEEGDLEGMGSGFQDVKFLLHPQLSTTRLGGANCSSHTVLTGFL